MDLFAQEPAASRSGPAVPPSDPGGRRPGPAAPLADRMRPRSLDEVVGQDHLLGPGRVLRAAIEQGELHSMILWGPPGSGKTTLASLMAHATGGHFAAFSAVLSGVKEIREVIGEAERARARQGTRTVLFVDEIHRFNRAQQDAFLPHVEKGTVVLVGATTENPSFEVNSALLSRCRVYVLHGLGDEDLVTIMRRALGDPERGLARSRPEVADDALRLIAGLANGDARSALNILELAVTLAPLGDGRRPVTETGIREAAQRRTLLYDKSGEEHYNLISALHKSLRDSDPDASLYWLTRMLEAGEDRLYVARRLVRFASEDVGNADPAALGITLAAKDAYDFLGSPEGELALAQATLYLALAPKSNAVYVAFNETTADVHQRPAEPVPLHIRNAPTRLMKGLGYGAGYQYAHDAPGARVEQDDLPDALRGREYYRPTDRGREAELGQRLADWRQWRRQAQARRAGESPAPEGTSDGAQ
jgi:putative ATPase